jgi:RNA polymerase sigma-70 factor, ECF subfamily
MFMASRHKFIGLAFSVLRNREDAEDAVQDALLSAYLHARSFEGRSAVSTWFTRIVFNAALMIRRKRKSLHTDSLPESSTTNETPWIEKIPASQPDPETSYAEKETLRSIDVLLSKMSPILRQAFTMAYLEEKSNEEACELLGIAAGTFKSRVFRARQHLMKKAQRVFSAPIRSRVRHSPMATSKSEYAGMAATPAEFASPEIAF